MASAESPYPVTRNRVTFRRAATRGQAGSSCGGGGGGGGGGSGGGRGGGVHNDELLTRRPREVCCKSHTWYQPGRAGR